MWLAKVTKDYLTVIPVCKTYERSRDSFLFLFNIFCSHGQMQINFNVLPLHFDNTSSLTVNQYSVRL